MPDPSNHKKAKTLNSKYILHNVEFESVSAAKYLGVTIVDNLSWTKHINITTERSGSVVECLTRDLGAVCCGP